MVVRFTVFMGILLGALSWVLLVPLTPPDFQASPGSAINDARSAGLMPQPGEMTVSQDVGHEVFEVPDEDAERLAEIVAAGGGAVEMEGMQMGEMAMESEADHGEKTEQPTQGMAMESEADHGGEAEPPTQGMAMESEADRGGEAEPPTQGMAMESEADHGKQAEGGHGGGDGLTMMDAGMAGMASRTVEIEMAEWEFSNKAITVKPGEVIRFVVRNSGNIPHEFMFMPGAAMQAVSYRLERADWNLLEHEAPFEQAIVLPGDSFEVVMRIEMPGTWMYMCMFPYHMQFGMMGVMVTEGMSMDGMSGMEM
jgi:uncharacterized cupredoxin-like copper-binding protein